MFRIGDEVMIRPGSRYDGTNNLNPSNTKGKITHLHMDCIGDHDPHIYTVDWGDEYLTKENQYGIMDLILYDNKSKKGRSFLEFKFV